MPCHVTAPLCVIMEAFTTGRKSGFIFVGGGADGCHNQIRRDVINAIDGRRRRLFLAELVCVYISGNINRWLFEYQPQNSD
jgi:hypothetical protein